MSEIERDDVTGVATTGHEWDGIKELNNPLPRWWVWTFYATIVWSVGYTVAYPAWPLVSSATTGVLGYSSRAEVNQELAAADAARSDYVDRIAASSVEDILADDELRQFASAAGAAAYRVNCVQCHGSGATGSAGYPNLNDDDWIWGGSVEEIRQTIAHGIRFDGDLDTRFSGMPAFAGVLPNQEIARIAAHVVSFSGEPSSAELAQEGASLYADNCAACHGEAGEGGRDFGAPSLADAIWLYGSSEAEIAAQIRAPHHGTMPGWAARLGDATVKELAVYIHTLGGGE
ncbi:MAG: cytochrome-c oxidase, cbb3-type subunit III [Rhizobiaceae bacterium]|nr:cytochrome-c oxidase, cbb3-type subunit III [Rhizobiaceae bacterium]MCV0407436.1 cytochrome-c oxidase, cbb3-type subunit III [Rhizobiaceae bacterium]